MTVRIILWFIAFIVPAVSLGVPVPHMVYILVPALAAVDGLGAGGPRRLAVWIGLGVLYEVVYQMPLGIFALSIGTVGAVHIVLMKVVRIDTRVPVGRWRPVHLVRAFLVAMLWMSALIVSSTLFSAVIGTGPPLSWQALWVVWFVRGAGFASAGMLIMMLGVLFWERTLRIDHIFSDHAIVQTTDISG